MFKKLKRAILMKKLNIRWEKAPLLALFPESWRPWVVCFSANLFCFYQILQSNMLNSLNASLLKTFSISATHMGYISASYFYSNVLFLFIAGFLIDYMPRRLILIVACFVNVLSILFFSLAQTPWQLFICHFITGLAETFSLTVCIRLAAHWFPRKHLAAVIGLMGGFAGLGGVIAQAPFTLSVNYFGWRTTLLVDAALGATIFLMIFLFVQDQPKVTKKAEELAKLTWDNFKKSFQEAAKNTQNWLAGIYAGLTTLPIFLLGALWGNQYLVHTRDFSPQSAALIVSMLFVGAMMGGPALGWVSDHFRTRRIPLQISAVLGFTISIALLLNTSSSPTLLCLAFFLMGGVTGAQSVAYSLVIESNKKNLISSAQGFVATLMMMSGFSQNLFSSLLEWGWQGEYKNDMPVYSLSDYQRALVIIPIAFCVAFLLARKLGGK